MCLAWLLCGTPHQPCGMQRDATYGTLILQHCRWAMQFVTCPKLLLAKQNRLLCLHCLAATLGVYIFHTPSGNIALLRNGSNVGCALSLGVDAHSHHMQLYS